MSSRLPDEWPHECVRMVLVAPRYPDLTGGSRVIANLSAALRTRGVLVEVISLTPGDGPAPESVTVISTRPHWHRGPAFRTAGSVRHRVLAAGMVLAKRVDLRMQRRRLRKALSRFGQDTAVVFTHVSTKIAADGAGWRPDDHGPILVGQHHSQFDSIDHEPWLRGAIEAHFGDLDAFTALTVEDASRFGELLSVSCFAVANPISPPPFKQVARQALAVTLARLSGEKQLDIMIRCFARATSTEELAHWRLEIYGEGDQRERLAACIAESAAGDRIRLAGVSGDVFEILRLSSLHLSTSFIEGFGMSILEAATMAVPSVAFDCSPGVRQLVGQERGWLVPDQDEAAFTQTLGEVLRQPEAIRIRGERARRDSSRYLAPTIIAEWAEVLGHAYRARGRRSAG